MNDVDPSTPDASCDVKCWREISRRTHWRWRCGRAPAASWIYLNGKRGVSSETALRLARYFGNSTMFLLNLQTAYELAVAEAEHGERIAAEVAPAA